MPKQWTKYKAEVERLYIVEARPLKDVRSILRARHGFAASTRAYRMKLIEWNLRKYRSNKDISAPETHLVFSLDDRSMALEPPQSALCQTRDFLQVGPGLTIPSEPLSASELLPLIQGPYASVYALEILLMKWQPCVEFIQAFLTFLQNPEYCQWISRSGSGGGPALFRLIEEVVAPEQQLNLTMMLIKAELSSAQRDTGYPHTHWQHAWHAVWSNEDWEEAKDQLYEDGIISQSVGDVFRHCALVEIAEKHLRACMSQLEDLRKYPGPVGSADSDDCRQKYLDILRDFRHAKLDVKPWFYKYSLQIIDWNEAEEGQESRHRRLELADEYRQRYFHLIDLQPEAGGLYNENIRAGSVEGAMDIASESINFTIAGHLTPDRASSGSPMSGTAPPSQAFDLLDNPSRLVWKSTLRETRKAFETLIEKWRSLNGFKEYAQSILVRDGHGIFIMEAAPSGNENLFEIIHERVPDNEQATFTKTLLMAFSTIPLSPQYSPWSMVWWSSVYSAPTWEKFQIRLDLPRMGSQLERIMSPAAARLLIDSTTVLVGERLLLGLKTQMISAKRRKSSLHDAAEAYASQARYQQQYMAILGEFQKRNLKVDQSWVSYLLNIM